ncbi:unnamed protein product, partial [Didymodactylos carnosus]
SRSEKDLSDVAQELKVKYNCPSTIVIPKDLSCVGAAKELYDETQRQGLQINVLVNNAGIGESGLFWQIPFEKDLEMIQLNVVSLVHLTKLYLPQMLQHNEGRILQLGSIASFQPNPYLSVYSATKAFISNFCDAMIHELKDSKVTMTLLVPGPTETDFFNKAQADDTKAGQSKHQDDAEKVAKQGYDSLMKGEHRAYGSTLRHAQVAIGQLLPNELV